MSSPLVAGRQCKITGKKHTHSHTFSGTRENKSMHKLHLYRLIFIRFHRLSFSGTWKWSAVCITLLHFPIRRNHFYGSWCCNRVFRRLFRAFWLRNYGRDVYRCAKSGPSCSAHHSRSPNNIAPAQKRGQICAKRAYFYAFHRSNGRTRSQIAIY